MRNIVVVALAILLSHGVAFAGVVTDTLDVTAQISTSAGECTVSVVNPIDFGISDGETIVNAEGALAVQCPDGQPYYVLLDGGNNPDFPCRTMSGPTGSICYTLANPTIGLWGDGATFPASVLAGTGTGNLQNIPIFGEMDPYGGIIAEESYSDIVTVTVSY